jgi:hypothetical protein
MGMLDVINRLAGESTCQDFDLLKGCPECRYWADTQGGHDCQHADGWRPSFGTIRCANLRVMNNTITAEQKMSSRR